MAIFGGSDNASAGMCGTGVFTSAMIDGFGSIFVSADEFETDTTSIVLDRKSAVAR